jgi:hypothetical protein
MVFWVCEFIDFYVEKDMNEFEQLYKRKQVLDENIAKKALFKLSVKDAIECV